MSASKKPAAKTASPKSSSAPPDAVQLLSAEHNEVKALFDEYNKLVESGGAAEDKQAIADDICMKLTVHATTEEEIFYPAARDVLGDDEGLIDEAEVEHATAKELIAQIEESSPDEELFDAKVTVLGEYINHHVKEEEGEIFPKARKAGLDMAALGAEISTRKEELMSEMGADETADQAVI